MYANLIQFKARPDRADEVAAWLSDATATLARDDKAVRDIYLVRTSPTSFAIFDTFATESDRAQHSASPLTAQLLSRGGELLAEPPAIAPGEILISSEGRRAG